MRNNLIGYDSYHFLTTHFSPHSPTTANIILELIPKDIFTIQIIGFIFLTCNVVLIAKIGELFDKKHGWIVGLIALCFGRGLLMKSFLFENDFLAYPFIFGAMLFGLKYLFEPKKHRFFVVSLLLIVAAGLLWEGSVYFFVGFLFTYFFGVSIFVVWFFSPALFVELVPNFGIAERFFGIVVFDWWLLFFGVFCFGWLKEWRFRVVGLLFFVLALFNSKLVVFSIPLLSVGILLFLKDFAKRYDLGGLYKYFFGVCLLLCLVWGFSLYFSEPSDSLFKSIDDAKLDYNLSYVCNDWDLGYWLKYSGIQTNSDGAHEIAGLDCNNEIFISRNPKPDCKLIRTTKDLNFFQC